MWSPIIFLVSLIAFKSNTTDHAVVFLSDDHGKSWRPGGYVPYAEDKHGHAIYTSESSVCKNSEVLIDHIDI